MSNDQLTWDEWYEALIQDINSLGLDMVEYSIARGDYDRGLTPHESAELFAKEQPPMMGKSY